ncbi:hypothetical protein RB653_002868 [Dictyostelium firmibasis]|uniref:Uncharacterized protein n=1 Tax=Dictyostelium firmibasis TaxID=79012 RepID=A0AAN7U3M2_9MYCE
MSFELSSKTECSIYTNNIQIEQFNNTTAMKRTSTFFTRPNFVNY